MDAWMSLVGDMWPLFVLSASLVGSMLGLLGIVVLARIGKHAPAGAWWALATFPLLVGALAAAAQWTNLGQKLEAMAPGTRGTFAPLYLGMGLHSLHSGAMIAGAMLAWTFLFATLVAKNPAMAEGRREATTASLGAILLITPVALIGFVFDGYEQMLDSLDPAGGLLLFEGGFKMAVTMVKAVGIVAILGGAIFALWALQPGGRAQVRAFVDGARLSMNVAILGLWLGIVGAAFGVAHAQSAALRAVVDPQLAAARTRPASLDPAAAVPSADPARATIPTALREEILATLMERQNCRPPHVHPTGDAVFQLEVSPSGAIDATLQYSSLQNAAIEGCIDTLLTEKRWPEPVGPEGLSSTFTFAFQRG